MSYTVKTLFRTVQGEGAHAGRPAIFCRFVGCNMWSGYEDDRERDAERNGADCPMWCDTDFTPEGATTYDSAADLADAIVEVATDGPLIDYVVCTGGEPLLQADEDLMVALHRKGLTVAIETNGTVPLESSFPSTDPHHPTTPDWVTCSPKLPEDQLVLERADELKLIVPDYRPGDYEDFAGRVTSHHVAPFIARQRALWVQPEDGPRFEDAARLAVEIAQERPEWRVSVQGHKVLGVE